MIIESAFLKLPEMLSADFAHRDIYEATVVHFFSMAVFMELDSRSITHPYDHVRIEKPFSSSDSLSRRVHSDLWVDLGGAVREVALGAGRMNVYGVRQYNWIEAKAFVGSTKGRSENKTVNSAHVLRDLLRVALLPHEHQGRIRSNARYLLLVFSEEPWKCLGKRRLSKRDGWLSPILEPGEQILRFDLLRDEGKSFRKNLGKFLTKGDSLEVMARIATLTFAPCQATPGPVFWGSLSRIRDFRVSLNGQEVDYTDMPNDDWRRERCEALSSVREAFMAKLEKWD